MAASEEINVGTAGQYNKMREQMERVLIPPAPPKSVAGVS
jgi:hypothetical protein